MAELSEHVVTDSLLHATLEATADGILVVNLEGNVVGRNSRFLQVWRVPRELYAVTDGEVLLAHMCAMVEDPDDLLTQVDDLTSNPMRSGVGETSLRDGRVIERFSLPQRLGNTAIGRVWSFRDVTSERRLRAELEHAAYTDAVTGVPNRARFLRDLADALQTPGLEFSVAFLDLDGFKMVNDAHGHRAGDLVLSVLARRLADLVPAGGSFARLGGDEFGFIVPVGVDSDMQAICTQAVRRCSQPVALGFGISAEVSASAGWTCLTNARRPELTGDESPEVLRVLADELLHEADLAMYAAKGSPRRAVGTLASPPSQTRRLLRDDAR